MIESHKACHTNGTTRRERKTENDILNEESRTERTSERIRMQQRITELCVQAESVRCIVRSDLPLLSTLSTRLALVSPV